MEKVLFVDFETRSKADLTLVGAHNYFLDPSTEILLIGFKFSHEDFVGIITNIKPAIIPKAFKLMINIPIVAHNYKFEFYGFQKLIRDGVLTGKVAEWFGNIENYRCTKATAQRYGISKSSLHDLSIQLNIKNKKLNSGKGLIQKYSISNKKTGEFADLHAPENAEDKENFIEYLKSDILATEEIYNLLPKLHEDPHEWSIFQLDKKMNEKGILTDTKNVKKLMSAYNQLVETTKEKAEKYGRVSNGKTLAVSSNVGLKALLADHGWQVDNVQEKTLKQIYPDAKKEVKEIIDIRHILQAKAPKKLDWFLTLPDSAGRYYDILNYYGTQPTGRWSGYGIQVHNFPRKATKDFDGDMSRLVAGENINIGSMLRGLLIHSKGNQFLVGDFSSIELILNAWISGCEKILIMKRNGENVYINFANLIYGRKIEKGSLEYQTGKTAVLGLGYGMGFAKFIETCEKDGIFINDYESDRIVKIYRKAYPEIPAFWRNIEKIFISALIEKGREIVFGQGAKQIKLIYKGRALRVTIPSGRVLYYYDIKLVDGKLQIGNTPVWGGVLTAHIVSSLARDILCQALLKCESEGLNPVLTIHDEIVNDIPKKQIKAAREKFEKIMNHVPAWAVGLPLGAEIGVMDRYGKL